MRIIKIIANIINLTISMCIILAIGAMAAATLSVESKKEQISESSTVSTIPTFDISNRVDIEYFLIDPQKYEEEFCMAQNIYFESSIDNKAGMAAVADVVLNRVKILDIQTQYGLFIGLL